MVIKTLHSSKLKIEQNEFSLTPGMNSGAPEGWTIPAPLVAPIVLNLGWTQVLRKDGQFLFH